MPQMRLVSRVEIMQRSKSDVLIAADSTMLRIVNRLMALSFGVHLEQLEQRIGLT